MSENPVAQAVAAFARATVALPDAALERGWPWRGNDEDVRLAFFLTYQEPRALAAGTAARRAAHGPLARVTRHPPDGDGRPR